MAFSLDVEMPAHVDRPVLAAPGPREISFGRIAGRVGPGTHRVVVYVNGDEAGDGARARGALRAQGSPAAARLARARGRGGRARQQRGDRRWRRCSGCRAADAPGSARPHEDAALARAVKRLVNDFPGVSAVYVRNLQHGRRGSLERARALPGRVDGQAARSRSRCCAPSRSGRRRAPSLDSLLDSMLVVSDNVAANELLEWIGGSGEGGAAQVNETLAALDLEDSHLYGGFLVAGAGSPIPLTVESQPSFEGKYTSAWDLAQLHTFVHQAANGGGPLLRLGGDFTAADARFLLWILAHSDDTGKLDRYVGPNVLVPHKAGWISDGRHDAGIVYGRNGAIVAAVMTYTGGGAGDPSDELAGRIAKAALDRSRAAREEEAST